MKNKNQSSVKYVIALGIILSATVVLSLGNILTGPIHSMLYSSINNSGLALYQTTPQVLTAEPAPKPIVKKIFSDIPLANKYANKLQFLKDEGIMKGYADGSFKPQNPMNKAEFIKTLVNAANEGTTPTTQTNCFKDVHNEWFAPYVCEAKQQGWIKGYGDNTFRPSASINRAEALKIFVNVYDLYTVNQAPDQNLSDFSSNQWYTPYVWTAGQEGLINDWTAANKTGGLSPNDMSTPMSRLDVATAIYQLETTENYPLTGDITCDYEPMKGEGGGAADAPKNFPPKDKYDIERTGMVMLNQDDFGPLTCFPTAAAMSFTWLETLGYSELVPELKSGSADLMGMVEELQKGMEWNETEGSNSADAITGIAKYLKAHGLADKFTIEFITKAPKNKGFVKHDALEGKTSLDGVGFSMERRGIKGEDVLNEMKKGQDVIIAIKSHVLEIAGIDEKPNKNGNYDVKIADTALGASLGAEITPDGKLNVGGKLTNIQDLLAVSPKKVEPKK